MQKKIKILTFAQGPFIESQKQLIEHIKPFNINSQKHLNDNDLDLNFKKEFSEILKFKKGYGFCIWKPFLILNELYQLNDNEILLYVDSTDRIESTFISLVAEHFNSYLNNNFFLNRGFINSHWTKRDTFVLMNCDSELFHNCVQLEAGVIGLTKTEDNLTIVKNWFNYCCNSDILIDKPNVCGKSNLPGYKEHRYDQSILTNIVFKKGINSHNLSQDIIKYNYYQPSFY
jgi:hypothetical protein